MRLKSRNRPLAFRIGFYFISSFTVALGLAFGLTYLTVAHHLETSSREVILTKWKEISTVLQNEGVSGLKTFLQSQREVQKNSAYLIRLSDAKGNNLLVKEAHSQKHFNFSELLKSKASETRWINVNAVDDEDHFEVYQNQVDGRFLAVGRSNEDREQVLEDLAYMFLVSGIILTFASAAIGTWAARRALEPLADLTAAIRKIESGDFSSRVSLKNPDLELQEVGKAFNRMAERTQRLIGAMKECLDNVAHDIRTPLTRIRNSLEPAILSGRSDLAWEALEGCAENVAEVTSLVDQLLDISEAESGALRLKIESVNVSSLIKEVIELYQFVAEEADVKIESSCDPMLNWPVDRQRVKRALANLLDNAIKFAPSESVVYIKALQDFDSLKIEVEDQGPGIAAEDLSRIWDRLYRSDKSRSKKGMGLGLSLVQAIVKAHNGQVGVTVNGGSLFHMSYPREMTRFS